MAEYMESMLPRFEEIRTSSLSKAESNALFDVFWYEVRAGFWQRFTWEEVRETWGDKKARKYDKEEMLRAVNNVCSQLK